MRAYAIRGRDYWLVGNELLETSALRERMIVARMGDTGATRAELFKLVTKELAVHDKETCTDTAVSPF